MMPSSSETNSKNTYYLALLCVIAFGACAYAMKDVVLPMILAVFVAALSRPLQVKLGKFMPKPLALILTLLVIAGGVVVLPILFAVNIQVITRKIPEYEPRINALGEDVQGILHKIGVDVDNISERAGEAVLGVLSKTLESLASFSGTTVLVLFLLIFMLSEAKILDSKLVIALKPSKYTKVSKSITNIQDRIQQYVASKALFAALNAGAAGLFTWLLGLDFPLLWVLLTFILYFIPTFGTLIATIPPVVLALIQFDGVGMAIATLAGLVLIFNVLGNILEPKFIGKAVSLSPLVVFASLMIWGWFFGVVGVLLSVPLTVAVSIVCEQVETLRPIAILLSDDPKRFKAEL